MKTRCQCGAVYNVNQSSFGKKVKCAKCATIFLVPIPTAAAPGSTTPPVAQSKQPQPQPASPQQKPTRQSKADRENELLAKYAGKKNESLEERIAGRRQERIESERYTTGFKYIVIGIIFIAVAIAAFFLFQYMERGDWVVPRLVAVLFYLGGKWWVTGLLGMIGIFHLISGIGSMLRMVDIDEEADLPEHF